MTAPVQTGSPAPAAAPAAPASGAPAAAPGAPAAPTSATDAAVQAARERIAAGGGMTPAGGDGGGAGAGAGEGGEGEAAAPAGGEGGEGGEAAPAGDEGGEAGAGAEGGEAAGEAGEASELDFTLPGLEERGEEEIVLTAPDKTSWERLNRLANDAEVGRQVKGERRTIARESERIESLQDQISNDPTGFILDNVAPNTRTEVAMQLLMEPGTLEGIQERLAKEGYEGGIAALLENPDGLKTVRALLGESRARMQLNLMQQAGARATMRQNAQRVATQIEQLLPERIVGAERERLYQAAIDDVSTTCRKLGIQTLDYDDVILLTSRVLRTQGITPAASAGNGGRGAAPGKAAASGSRTGAQFQQGSAARRAAAAAAPGGAGAPATKVRPTLPPDTQGRIEYARKHGLRATLGKD